MKYLHWNTMHANLTKAALRAKDPVRKARLEQHAARALTLARLRGAQEQSAQPRARSDTSNW
jgi:hypothetical protein